MLQPVDFHGVMSFTLTIKTNSLGLYHLMFILQRHSFKIKTPRNYMTPSDGHLCFNSFSLYLFFDLSFRNKGNLDYLSLPADFEPLEVSASIINQELSTIFESQMHPDQLYVPNHKP